MNQDNDRQDSRELDPQVSAHYERLADEKTPADLDRLVLREAARAVRADNRKGSFGAWFRPVAFMAMVGLSLAIILDLSDTNFFSPPDDLSIDTAPPAVAPPAPAADADRKNGTQMTISEMKRQKRSVAAQSLTVDAPEISSDAFTAETERAEQRVQDAASTTIGSLQSPAEAPAPASQFRQLQAQDMAAAVADAPLTNLQCFEEEKVDPELWWQCIKSLRQEGLNEFADMEFENLRKAFPDFAPPE